MAEHGYRVFISHASGDLGVARLIQGYEGFVGVEFIVDDEDLRAGEEFRPKLKELIVRSRELLILVSPLALDSHWLSWELGVAEGQNLTIVPILHGIDMSQLDANRKWRHLIGQRSSLPIKEIFTYFHELRSRVEEGGSREQPLPPEEPIERLERIAWQLSEAWRTEPSADRQVAFESPRSNNRASGIDRKGERE